MLLHTTRDLTPERPSGVRGFLLCPTKPFPRHQAPLLGDSPLSRPHGRPRWVVLYHLAATDCLTSWLLGHRIVVVL